jgi:biotin carboxyl carrier protein
VSLIAVALYLQCQWRAADDLLSELPPGYRNNPYRDSAVKLQTGDREIEVSWRQIENDGYEVKIFDSSIKAQVLSCAANNLRLSLDGRQRSFRVIERADWLYVHSTLGSCAIRRLPRHPVRQSAPEAGSANSPMPGQVLKILVELGQRISTGDPLLILEAMKMEHTMRASVDGVVEAILVIQGEVVGPGQTLVQIAAR